MEVKPVYERPLKTCSFQYYGKVEDEKFEEEEEDSPTMETCIECKTLGWNEEMGVCHSCGFKTVTPNMIFMMTNLSILGLC